jgi:predicted glycosyltransferase
MPTLTLPHQMDLDQFRGTGIRFILYSHDTFGLGHIRRSLSLAAHFTSALPDSHVLIVTGSPFAHSYALPPRTDYIKMPAVTKQSNGAYRSRSLDLEFNSIRDLRATLLRETARAYHPDVFIVDHAPQGLKGEVLSTLAMLRETQPECLRVLGQRDIIDAGHVVRKTWNEDGVYNTLEEDYDLILVYGTVNLYDINAEYALPEPIHTRVRYCGYLDRLSEETLAEDAPIEEARTAALQSELFSASDRLVVVTAGGGGDGFALMRAYLSGLQRLSSLSFASLLLVGPFMPEAEQRELHEMAAALPAGLVRIETFLVNPLPFLRAADLVVAMAGYNTTCELLALQQRILLVPRATPRQEQVIRASLLAQHRLAYMLHPDLLTPERLIEYVQNILARPRPQKQDLAAAGISFDGQSSALKEILAGLNRLPEERRLVVPLLTKSPRQGKHYENRLYLH